MSQSVIDEPDEYQGVKDPVMRQHLDTVWEGLQALRDDLIPEGDEVYDEQWNDICHSMAVISETLAEAEKK